MKMTPLSCCLVSFKSSFVLQNSFSKFAFPIIWNKNRNFSNTAIYRNSSVSSERYANEVTDALNKQINLEFYSSYFYLSMATYFSRSQINLPHIAKWLTNQSDDERQHAMKLIQFQTLRGAHVKFDSIAKPGKEEWESSLEAFEAALDLEKKINAALLNVHAIGERQQDPHLCGFIEEKYLREQVRSIDEITRFVSTLKRAGKGLGEYVFDTKNFGRSEKSGANETITELSNF